MKKLIFILLIINLGCSSSNDLQFINRFADGNTKLLNIINNNDIQLIDKVSFELWHGKIGIIEILKYDSEMFLQITPVFF